MKLKFAIKTNIKYIIKQSTFENLPKIEQKSLIKYRKFISCLSALLTEKKPIIQAFCNNIE